MTRYEQNACCTVCTKTALFPCALPAIYSNLEDYFVIFQVGVVNKRHVANGTCKVLLLLFATIH